MDDMKDRVEDKLDHEQAEGRKDQAGGTWDELKGKVKKNVGDALDDTSMEAEGRVQEAGGKMQKETGEARAKAADAAQDAID